MQAKKFWKQASPIIMLTIVVVVCVSILSYVDSITRDKIAAQENAAVEEMLSAMFPEMTGFDYENDIYIIQDEGETTGYAFLAIGSGYGGDINILVGLNMDETIKQISIISQEETPGLGNRITEPEFTDQFKGLSPAEVELARNGGKVDAITSSTISSSAVADAVRETALEKIKELQDNR